MRLRAVECVLVCCFVACAVAARPAEPTDAERRASFAGLSLMQRTGFLQIPVNRQAVAETSLDQSVKKQIDAIFAKMESDLRPMIASVQSKPESAETLVRQGRAIVSAAQEEVRKLVNDEQFDQLAHRTRLVQVQLMAITAGPHSFDEARAALQLTAEQQKRIDALLNQSGVKVRKLTDALTNEDRMIPSAEQLVTLSLETRKQLRAILTDEQLKKLDESTNLELSSGQTKGRGH